MTVWKPDVDPTTEIHQNLFTNGSGHAHVHTTFREIMTASPVAIGSSYKVVQATGFTVIHSRGSVDVYVQGSKGGLLAGSQNFDMVVRGIR